MRTAVHGWGNKMLLNLERDVKKKGGDVVEDSVSLTNDSAEEDLPEEFFTRTTTSNNKGDEKESVDSENQLIVEKLDTRVKFEVVTSERIDMSVQE